MFPKPILFFPNFKIIFARIFSKFLEQVTPGQMTFWSEETQPEKGDRRHLSGRRGVVMRMRLLRVTRMRFLRVRTVCSMTHFYFTNDVLFGGGMRLMGGGQRLFGGSHRLFGGSRGLHGGSHRLFGSRSLLTLLDIVVPFLLSSPNCQM
jgi:hypothetical protein